MIKKLPKKYPVFFEESFTRMAENLVCKNVDSTGKVIFVHMSRQSIFGITVKASRPSLRRCDTDREMVFRECVVSASVKSNSSPAALLKPSVQAQFFPI